MNDKRSALWRWVIPAGLGVAGFFSLLIGRGGLTADTQVEFLRILCDALFIPGAMLTCVGLLAICAGNGAFDAVTYGVKKLFSLLRGEAKRAEMPQTYFDYVVIRRGRPTRTPVSLLAIGGGLLAAAVIVLLFYFRAAG
ncbi:MAG: DUF3899 domain-containing protein [Clostridia bacterium]|nr:DUF3899 domain-containing protein [Clostridia bacterium]